MTSMPDHLPIAVAFADAYSRLQSTTSAERIRVVDTSSQIKDGSQRIVVVESADKKYQIGITALTLNSAGHDPYREIAIDISSVGEQGPNDILALTYSPESSPLGGTEVEVEAVAPPVRVLTGEDRTFLATVGFADTLDQTNIYNSPADALVHRYLASPEELAHVAQLPAAVSNYGLQQ